AVAPAELFDRLAARFVEALAIWRRGEGFAEIRVAWLQAAAGLGAPIRISGPDGGREGVFEALDASGRLLLRRAGRLEIVEAGDMRLRDSPSAGEVARETSGR